MYDQCAGVGSNCPSAHRNTIVNSSQREWAKKRLFHDLYGGVYIGTCRRPSDSPLIALNSPSPCRPSPVYVCHLSSETSWALTNAALGFRRRGFVCVKYRLSCRLLTRDPPFVHPAAVPSKRPRKGPVCRRTMKKLLKSTRPLINSLCGVPTGRPADGPACSWAT